MKIKCLIDTAEGYGLFLGEIYEAVRTDFDDDGEILVSTSHGECFMTTGEYEIVDSNQGIKTHDGQKLLVQHILDTDEGLSENTRKILEELIK